jgi:hypothetical protein
MCDQRRVAMDHAEQPGPMGVEHLSTEMSTSPRARDSTIGSQPATMQHASTSKAGQCGSVLLILIAAIEALLTSGISEFCGQEEVSAGSPLSAGNIHMRWNIPPQHPLSY